MKSLEDILEKCVENKNGCLLWTKGFQRSGRHGQLKYPSIRFNKKNWRGNRLVLSLSGTKLNKKIHALHRCDNTMCLNPKHLFPGTHSDNMQDKIKKKRDHNLKKTHCANGHPFTGDNLIIRKTGARSCRKCMRLYWNKFDKLNREARRVAALARYYAKKGG